MKALCGLLSGPTGWSLQLAATAAEITLLSNEVTHMQLFNGRPNHHYSNTDNTGTQVSVGNKTIQRINSALRLGPAVEDRSQAVRRQGPTVKPSH